MSAHFPAGTLARVHPESLLASAFWFGARDSDRLLCPGTQRVGILEEVLRELIVLHRSAVVAEGAKWSHSPRYEIRACRVINLEVKRVIRDQSKEEIARVNPDAAEHRPRADSWHCPAQLVEDENPEAWADWHGRNVDV